MHDVAPGRLRDFIDLPVGRETCAVPTYPMTEGLCFVIAAPVLRRCDSNRLVIGHGSRKTYIVYLLLAFFVAAALWGLDKFLARSDVGRVLGLALVMVIGILAFLKVYLALKTGRHRVEVCFDRKVGQVAWKGGGWSGPLCSSCVPLRDVVAVQILFEERVNGYQLILILKGFPWARRLQLAQDQNLRRLRQLGRELSDFLKVPLLDHTRDGAATEGDRELAKVVVELHDAPVETESLWARPLGGELYELRNTPWYAFDLHFHDVVRALPDQPGSAPRIVEVVRRSGHKTVRVSFLPEIGEAERVETIRWLHRWRVSYERRNHRLYALDVEPEADYSAVCNQLDLWKLAGLLVYETGTRKDAAELCRSAAQKATVGARFVVRLLFEWGGGCLWCRNDAARERFGVGPIEDWLPLTAQTLRRLQELSAWHDGALNWEYPPDPTPWSAAERERFAQAAGEVLSAVRAELGPEFEVVYEALWDVVG